MVTPEAAFSWKRASHFLHTGLIQAVEGLVRQQELRVFHNVPPLEMADFVAQCTKKLHIRQFGCVFWQENPGETETHHDESGAVSAYDQMYGAIITRRFAFCFQLR